MGNLVDKPCQSVLVLRVGAFTRFARSRTISKDVSRSATTRGEEFLVRRFMMFNGGAWSGSYVCQTTSSSRVSIAVLYEMVYFLGHDTYNSPAEE